ncbi:hypothetical protein L596_026056 [Steinernema carpocapsae]|uniref:Uncharacterized protein n=1 Tax=Steinernema carpocapsae TaxID=34508 RepID=A0A4U5M085_STECR|nr:hypothetical protein L596_026056 [Steinernema carpocapsae]
MFILIMARYKERVIKPIKTYNAPAMERMSTLIPLEISARSLERYYMWTWVIDVFLQIGLFTFQIVIDS